jgi:hypothetical protein
LGVFGGELELGIRPRVTVGIAGLVFGNWVIGDILFDVPFSKEQGVDLGSQIWVLCCGRVGRGGFWHAHRRYGL